MQNLSEISLELSDFALKFLKDFNCTTFFILSYISLYINQKTICKNQENLKNVLGMGLRPEGPFMDYGLGMDNFFGAPAGLRFSTCFLD